MGDLKPFLFFLFSPGDMVFLSCYCCTITQWMEGGGDPTKPKAFCIALHSTVDRYIALYKRECTDFMTRSAQIHKCTNFCRPTGGLIFSHEISSLRHMCSDGFMLPVKEIVNCVYNLNEVDALFFLLKNGCSTHHGHCLQFFYQRRQISLIRLLFLLRNLYLSGMWFGVAQSMDTKKKICLKRLDCIPKI